MGKIVCKGETQMENPNYYAVIPAKVRYDDRLRPNEKLLYGEIVALSNKDGKCWASNSYFAKIYKVGTSTISTWINNLAENGYVVLTYINREGTKEIEKREITINEVLPNINRGIHKNEIGIHKKIKGYSQNPKENNTSINKKKKKKEERNFQEELKSVTEFYENNITLITQFISEDIDKYLHEGLYAELIIEAMKEAVSRNVRNWKYIASILNDCIKNKIYTAEQFKMKQQEFKTNQTSKKKQTDKKIEYEEVSYTEEEYNKIVRKG